MHKQKKAIITIVTLLLCFFTLFSTAFAYTEQNAQAGFPAPPSNSGGAVNSGNPNTTYNSTMITGYRFTCWRSEDFEKYSKTTSDPAKLTALLKAHDEPGYQLGHSINIIVNTGRTDYANGYNQTGIKAPRMFTNEEQTETLNKISLAQTEIKSDKELGTKKLTHSTSTDLCTLHYSGESSKGTLNSVSKSSSFTFTKQIWQLMDKNEKAPGQTILNTKFKSISTKNPLKIYSGYQSKNDEASKLINTGAGNGQAGNVYTYVYGYQYSDEWTSSTSASGWDESKDYLTISDIDYEDSKPFLAECQHKKEIQSNIIILK